jgi:polyketide synthase 12
MAAVQLSRHLGAHVLATASSGKWDAVRGLGVEPEAIASSRDLGFEDAFRRVTGGRGADVVLNSLAGDFIDATLRLMPRGGRFVEMGKLDLRDPRALAAAHPGVDYRPFDLMDAGPERIGAMLAELADLFAAGVLKPLPVRGWHVSRAREAFQFVSQARHIGKVVLTLGPGWNREGTVLISGGTGGIGARLARHVVTAYGVRSLLVLSRSGPDTDAARRLTASLAELGAAAKVVACDVADPAAVAAALAEVPADRPLTAVVHAAGVVDDGVLGSLNAERVDRVMLPKADGAWNLHRATRGLPLDAFVLFSSAAGLLGSPGQANYAAGNAFLDGLAGWRRARGLPAVSCAWGLWAGAEGMGGRVAEGRSRSGGGLTADQGLALFDAAGMADEPVLLPMRMDLAGIEAGAAETGQVPPPLRALVTPGRVRRTARQAADGSADGRPGWLADLPLRDPREQIGLLVDLVRAQAARVLRHASTDAVEADRAFSEIGFDSLTAIELRNGIGAATGLRLPATVVFDHPTPQALAGFLLGELVGADGPAAGALLAELDRMESALGAVRATGAEAGQILVRLQALTMKWTGLRAERGAEAEEGQGLREATDDELFAFIDRDLGLS